MDEENPKYGAITIDTSIFDKYGLRIETGFFQKLAQFKHGQARVVLSDMIIGELRSHLEKEARDAQAKVEAGAKAALHHLLVLPDTVMEAKAHLLGEGTSSEIAGMRVDRFINNCSAQIVISKKHIDVDRLIEDYFASTAPFSESGKKKSEFPDAIALLSLESWAKAIAIKILVVSTDGDWKRFCDNSEVLDLAEDFGAALNVFQPHNFAAAALVQLENALLGAEESEIVSTLEGYLSDAVGELDIYPDASSAFSYDYDVDEVTYVSFHPILDNRDRPIVRVIEVQDENVALDCQITIRIGVSCSFDFSVKDSIDKDYVKIGSSSEYKEFEFDTGVLINGIFEDENDLSTFSISDIELTERIDTVEFGEIEPDWGEPDWG